MMLPTTGDAKSFHKHLQGHQASFELHAEVKQKSILGKAQEHVNKSTKEKDFCSIPQGQERFLNTTSSDQRGTLGIAPDQSMRFRFHSKHVFKTRRARPLVTGMHEQSCQWLMQPAAASDQPDGVLLLTEHVINHGEARNHINSLTVIE